MKLTEEDIIPSEENSKDTENVIFTVKNGLKPKFKAFCAKKQLTISHVLRAFMQKCVDSIE